MSAHVKFKKSALYISVASIIQWKNAKKLYIGLFLSFVSHQTFAENLKDTQGGKSLSQQIEIQAKEQNDKQLTTNSKNDASEKIELPKLDENIPNSMQMLEQQLKDNKSIGEFKNINLDDLEPLPSFEIDQSMVNEIYSVADEAKKEALAYRANQKNEVMVSDATKQELAEINVAPINVDHLMSSIQSESKIIVEANESGATLRDLGLESDEVDPPKKLNAFKRILYSVRPPKNEENAAVERITAHVRMVDDGRSTALSKKEIVAQQKLKANIEAKLSSYTVEVFDDYTSAVPQLRALSKNAAEAVGFYNAIFHFEKTGRASLDVLVEPNSPVIVDKQNIEFTGEGANLPQFQVIGLLPYLQVGDVLNQGLYTKTKDRINEAASNNGFFDSFWRIHDVQVFQPEDDAEINLKYETGTRYKLGSAEFVMSDPAKEIPLDRDVLEKMVPWKDGQDYTLWRVTSLVNNLTNSRYFNYVLVDTAIPDAIETPLELTPDVQALLEGDDTSDDLRAQLTKPATLNSKKEVTQNVVNEAEFAGTVQNTGKGRSSNVLSDADQAEADKQATTEKLKEQARIDKKIPVLVTLNADILNNTEVGLGYGSDTGFRLRGQYRRAIVNRRGHSFDANMELSQIRQSIEARYNIPFNHPLNDYFTLVGGYEREERNNVSQSGGLLIEAGVAGIDRIIKNPLGGWQQIWSTRYRLDRLSDRGSLSPSAEDDIPDWFYANLKPQQESLLLGYEISRSDTNKRVNPTQGFSQTYKVEVASKHLLTDTDLAIVNAGWRFLFSYGENDNNQIIGRANLGYIFAKDFKEVPYNLRYFAGGDQTIRGFDYKSLSPKEFGYKIGGQAQAIGSLEYNYQFMEGWRAAIFSDFGNAYDKSFSNPTAYSIGLGVRWASPIGPIRIDLASGISDKDHPIRLHFFIGPQI